MLQSTRSKRAWAFSALLAVCGFSLAAPMSWAALQAGAQAPVFTTPASLAGKELNYSLTNALKKGPVVVYFYPSAYTSGCNIQAREFAQNIEKFAAAGASVVGVSLDSIQRLNDFSADPEYCGGKLTVASDPDGKIARSYELKITERPGMKDSRGLEIDHAFTERTTFIVTSDGKIAATIGGMSALENVKKSLETVQQLAAAKGVQPNKT